MLQPADTKSRRERILYFGAWGTGKTTAWLNIAKWSQETESPSKFYVIDTDNALDAFLEPGTQYENLVGKDGNVEVVRAFEWEEYTAATEEFSGKLLRDDWLIVDFVTPAWDAVQGYYIQEIYKDDPTEYFLMKRRENKGGSALDGRTDWGMINKLYKDWMLNILHRTQGHKFMTAEVATLGQGESPENRATFGSYGVKPKGQKQLGHQPHTLLLGKVDRQGEITMTTIKDREREPFEEKAYREFTIDYLCNVAGWTL